MRKDVAGNPSHHCLSNQASSFCTLVTCFYHLKTILMVTIIHKATDVLGELFHSWWKTSGKSLNGTHHRSIIYYSLQTALTCSLEQQFIKYKPNRGLCQKTAKNPQYELLFLETFFLTYAECKIHMNKKVQSRDFVCKVPQHVKYIQKVVLRLSNTSPKESL